MKDTAHLIDQIALELEKNTEEYRRSMAHEFELHIRALEALRQTHHDRASFLRKLHTGLTLQNAEAEADRLRYLTRAEICDLTGQNASTTRSRLDRTEKRSKNIDNQTIIKKKRIGARGEVEYLKDWLVENHLIAQGAHPNNTVAHVACADVHASASADESQAAK